MSHAYTVTMISALSATLALAACGDSPPKAQPEVAPASAVARPADTTANLPSDSGSQSTLPTGAVTGAGQPEGTGRQTDVGAPGGLEPRARAEERADQRADATAVRPRADTPSIRETPPVLPEGERRGRPPKQTRG